MTERISDERLAEIKAQLPFWRTQQRYVFAQELMPAIEAERGYARMIDERNRKLYGDFNNMHKRAEQAESGLARVAELPKFEACVTVDGDEYGWPGRMVVFADELEAAIGDLTHVLPA